MVLRYFKNKKTKEKLRKEIQTLKDRKGFLKAGMPRFGRLFGRDSLISSWQLLDCNPGICKATLEVLSQTQGKVVNNDREEEPGKIIHETDMEKNRHPDGYFPFPYYGSVDATPLFLIVFSLYFKKTNDIKFLNSRWENILMALIWMEEYGDKDNDYFLEYQKNSSYLKARFHQGWKDSAFDSLKIEPPVAIVEAQGYQYLALKNILEIIQTREDRDLAEKIYSIVKKEKGDIINKFQVRAKKLKEEFNKKFWMEDEKYFALALDGKKNQRKAITSNPGHLLFTGIIDEDKVEPCVRRLFEKDIFTPFGIRTHSKSEPDFNSRSYHLGSVWPHDNWIIAQGLKKYGYKKEYLKVKNAIWGAYKKVGYLPEFYGVVKGDIVLEMEKPPCYPQAWSSGALLNFLEDF